MKTNQQLTALQTTIVVAVAIYFFAKAVVEIYVAIGKFAYNLGRECGSKYYANNSNTVLSDVTVAIETEAKVITQQVGNYLCGVALVASFIHSLYLTSPSLWEVKLEIRYYLRKLLTSNRVVGLYN